MTDEIIRSGDLSEFAQCVCGSVWFDARVAYMLGSKLPTAVHQPVACIECGTEVTVGIEDKKYDVQFGGSCRIAYQPIPGKLPIHFCLIEGGHDGLHEGHVAWTDEMGTRLES